EIGFGSGRHLLYRAENEPNTTFIGIEIHKPSIEQLLKQIEIRNLKNIYVLDFDARHFFETIPSNRVSTIYIHFPVPWDKQPHRRVIQPNFLQEAKRILKVGGILELRTDSENYFQYSLELFLREPKLKMELWKNIPIEIESKYEARWKKMKKNIYNFRLENLDSSPPKESWIVPDGGETQGEREKIEELLDYRVLEKEWFIHVRDILRLRDGRYLLSIVAGSYTYPQHQFILFNGNKIEYLIRKPLDIEINVKIDKVLRELL
ncbi:MAG TPA: tRNA (guanosine(46)-N7)-methyltransferase TrmB, partial [Campylobacterales bacterium]|nr:tRNA (guanosine(46)-N7)-methyltransferase TrmB [Campylobacterales bacterium]